MKRGQLDINTRVSCPPTEGDADDQAVIVDVDELVGAGPHPFQNVHLVRHETDGPIVAAPHAAEIAQLAQLEARDWRDPGIALAAREHRDRAQVQVATLRRQGIVVLDEPDDKLDQAVLDAYLLLRQRKRI